MSEYEWKPNDGDKIMAMGMFITEDESFRVFDISAEKKRTYFFPNGSSFTIPEPLVLLLHLDSPQPEFGGQAHRVVDKLGSAWYIPRGWLALKLEVADGKAKVQF